MSRVGKSIKNVGYGVSAQLITAVLNFAARIAIVRILGQQANGLNGLFTEVIAMLSLAELGVGSVITYSLYGALGNRDEERICRLMWLFKTAYTLIGAVILAAGLALSPIVHLMVTKTDYSIGYIRVIFILFTVKTASTYFYSYKTSLLIADQKNYVVTNITVACKAVCTVVGIAALWVFESFEVYLVINILFNFVTNIAVSWYAGNEYPFLGKNTLRLPKKECLSILGDIRHIFISKLSGKITNSTDNILLSVFVSTVVTGIYSNYSMISSNIKLLFNQVMGSMTGSFGNMFACESPLHCAKVLKRLEFAFFMSGAVVSGGFLCAAAPFMEMCFGKGNDLSGANLFLCALNLFLGIFTVPLWNVATVAGMFKEDKKSSMMGSGVNLVVSLALGKLIGMAGIFIGTVCTYVLQLVYKTNIVYKQRLSLPWKENAVRALGRIVMVSALMAVEYMVCGFISTGNSIADFILRGGVSVMLSVGVLLGIYFKNQDLWYFLDLVLNQAGKKIKR